MPGNLHMSDTTGHLLPVTQPGEEDTKEATGTFKGCRIEGWALFFQPLQKSPANLMHNASEKAREKLPGRKL